MKYDTLHTKPLGISLPTPIRGGGKSLIINTLHRRFVFVFIIFLASFLCLSCQKEAFRYPEMQAYYAESCQLPIVSGDSITRFAHKVDAFVAAYPDAKADPLYPGIRENIQKVWFRLTITVNDEWDGETFIYF